MNAESLRAFSTLDTGSGSWAFNMALDETLLAVVASLGQPVLRFYGWIEPAASFGYFQRIAEVEAATPLRPLVRRPTGGGVVPHDADWTYSLAFPPQHSWHRLRAEASYLRAHSWLQGAFALMGLETQLAPCCRKELPGQCFSGYEKSDLLWMGRKIAGAAQRRNRDGLLIQGSVQPPPGAARDAWQSAMCDFAARAWGASCAPLVLPPEWMERARRLAAEKYAQDSHNRRR